mmetsp:Transcript_27153/g.73123  ORF Transcript_27153/g.73123 Transcript_27153/m.73123 type:complete len:341 (-) Transcript_27153:438-1460(-)
MLSCSVGLDQHPLPRDVLGRGAPHLTLALGIWSALCVNAHGVAREPFVPFGALLGHQSVVVKGRGKPCEQHVRSPLPLQRRLRGLLRGHVGEEAPEDGVVHPRLVKQLLELGPEAVLRLVIPGGEAELGSAHFPVVFGEYLAVLVLHNGLEFVHRVPGAFLIEQGYQRAREGHEIYLRGQRLALEPKLALHVGGEGAPEGIVLLHKAERTVVHGAAAEEAVVRVHVALDVAHAQPRRGQARLAHGKLPHHGQELGTQGLGLVHLGKLAPERMPDQRLELADCTRLLARSTACMQLQVTDAQEGGRSAAGDGAALLDNCVRRVVAPAVALRVPHATRVLRP